MNYLLKKIALIALFFVSFVSSSAYAIPAFSRQTGFDCKQCHTVFPELTSTGRYFKLSGYTMGSSGASIVDNFSGMAQLSTTKNANTSNGNPDAIDPKKDGKLSLDQVSVFFGGKLLDNLGAFIQYTYDGTNLIGSSTTKDVAHHISADNIDIRYVKNFSVADKELLLGLTLNNNPTAQDIYNTTPTWSFPYSSSANMNSPASTMIEGTLAAKVKGVGVYSMYDDLIYAEVAAYQSNRSGGLLHFMSYNIFNGSDNSNLHGTALYGRVALQKTLGDNFFMVGGYMLNSKMDPDITKSNGGLFDEYKDRAIDAQYSYTKDKHIVTAMATKIWEKSALNNTFVAGGSANSDNFLTTTKAKISYYYNQAYGVSAAAFSTKGSTDNILYDPSVSTASSPDSSGKVVELDYLPMRKTKLSLQYTMYDKFGGAKDAYNTAGTSDRNAKDNNNLFLSAWIMF